MEIEIAKDGTIRIIPSDSRRNFGEHINRLLESEREIVL
jgi:flagellar basal body rod protein FlgF